MGRLPSGYQELTHIESTGTQYIDTGLTISSDSVFVLDSVFVPHDIGSGSLFGSAFVDSTGHASRRFWLSLYNSQLYCAYGTLNTSFLDLSVGDRYSLNLNFKNNIQTVSVNGKSYSFSGYTDGSITTNLLFFARSNYATSLAEDFSLVSLGEVSFSIDDSVFDFVPCKRLSDGAIGMYDLVSQSFFGNSGTGSFIAGAPVIEPTWGSGLANVTQKDLLARRTRICKDVSIHLPAAFQRCEWIGTTGTQFLDTNHNITQNTEIIITGYGINGYLFGCGKSGVYMTGVVSSDDGKYWGRFRTGSGQNNNWNIKSGVPVETIQHKFKLTRTKFFIDDVLIGTESQNYNFVDNTLHIFGENVGYSYNVPSQAVVSEIIINEKVVLARNMISCYLKTDWNGIPAGTIGMYDLRGSICPLTNTPFYINAGTGKFTKGADV